MDGGNFGERRLGHHGYTLNKKYFEAKGKRNTGVRWASQVVKEVWNITWKYWVKRSAWAHSDQSLWYKMDCLSLQRDITSEYERGSEVCSGLAVRWWKGSLEVLLATRVQDKKRWLESVRLRLKKLIRRRVPQESRDNFLENG